MTLDEIAAFIAQLESGDATSLFHRAPDGCTLRLERMPRPEGTSVEPQDIITAPAAGFFRSAHPLVGTELIALGKHVHAKEIIGFVQVGPALRPVMGRQGTVRELLARDGEIVGFGTPICSVAIGRSRAIMSEGCSG